MEPEHSESIGTGVPASSPLTDMRSITEVVPRLFALCAEKSVQRAFSILGIYSVYRDHLFSFLKGEKDE